MNRYGTQHNYIRYIANCMCSLLSYIAPRTPAVYGATLVGMHPHTPFPVVPIPSWFSGLTTLAFAVTSPHMVMLWPL